MMTMNRRHNGKTSPPPSPQDGRGECEPLSSLLVGIGSSHSPTIRKRLRSPRGQRNARGLITWVKCLGIGFTLCLFVNWMYRARLIIEENDPEDRSLGGAKHRHGAIWIRDHAVRPLKENIDKVKGHLMEHLRGNVSGKEQKKIMKIFKDITAEEQDKVMEILQHVLGERQGEGKTKTLETKDESNRDDDDIEDDDLKGNRVDETNEERPNSRMDQEQIERVKYEESIKPLSSKTFADRHILNFLSIVHDDKCRNPVVDMSDPNYTTQDAVEIFHKCRLLIFKNAFDKTMLEEYREQFAQFMQGLKDGSISRSGTNTGGDSIYLAGRGRGRYEIVLPERLIHPDVVANEKIIDVVQHPMVLGANSALRSLQSLVSEGNQGGGTPGQPWHYDQGFLFGQERGGLSNFGIAGHDLPPAAISLALPLLDMERNLGPTEFCIGSSALNGVGPDVDVVDQSLIEEGSLFDQYYQHDAKYCPAECWISPLLNFGDAVLWDYGVRHRGGWNASPYLRSIVLLIYSKRWFDDINFGDKKRDHQPKDESPLVTDLLTRTRLAKPYRDEASHEKVNIPLKEMAHIYPNDPYEWEREHKRVDYIATNYDVEGNPTLYIDGVAQGYLPPGSSKVVEGSAGDIMELRLGNKLVGRFQCSDDGQFVFTKDATL